MQQVLNEVGQIAQRLAAVIWQVLQFIWNWSFGAIVKMFQHAVQQSAGVEASNLRTRDRGARLFPLQDRERSSEGSAIGAWCNRRTHLRTNPMLPQIVWAGLIAFGGAWVITTWTRLGFRSLCDEP